MRKWGYIVFLTLLLAGGAVLCALRWQAWFGMPEEPVWTGVTQDYTFPVFATDTTPEKTTILVLGDIHNRLTQADYDTLAARVPEAEALAQVGDWMDRGQNYYYQLLLREWIASSLYGMPVIVTPGNHEYSKGVHKALSPVWEHAFAHPSNGPAGVPGASYYVDLPSVRFITIDTNPLNRLVYLTRTLTWLRATMAQAREDGRFIVVMMHHPVLSVGKGRANVLVYSAFRHALGETDLVLAGHDHNYMRRAPFVVLNTAGKPKKQQFFYTPEAIDSIPTYSVIESTICPKDLFFKTYRLSDGALIDSLYVHHD